MMQVEARDTFEREIELLLEAIYFKYQHDFRHYAFASLRRRLTRAMEQFGCRSVSQLQDRALHDPESFGKLLQFLTVQVSEMFRDPGYFKTLREEVAPVLKTYPSVRLWVAGCSTGEEVWSLLILLSEEGLLDRALVYATDINTDALRAAEAGVYSIDRIAQFSTNYLAAGGTRSLSDYYHAAYGAAVFDRSLRQRVLFADHSLATDNVFSEMHLVSCRNVLIYFVCRCVQGARGRYEDLPEMLNRAVTRVGDEDAKHVEAIVIGASAGGVEAVGVLLSGLSPGFSAAVMVVIHVPSRNDDLLARVLAPRCALPLLEASDKLPAEAGAVYIAPAGYHLLVEPERTFALSLDEPVNFSRPSIDVLFESAAYAYRDQTLGIVLTGANADGAEGLRIVREFGGLAWVQDPASASSPAMPAAAIERAGADRIMTLEEMTRSLQAVATARGGMTA